MIRQILDFSRRSVFERQVLDLLPLLKEEEKLLQQTLPESIEIGIRLGARRVPGARGTRRACSSWS